MSAAKTHFRTCHLCEAMCGLAIDLAGREIVAIRGDKDDPFSRGHLCPKAVALKDVHEDPDRLRHPLRRTPSGWVEIGWDEALDEAAARSGSGASFLRHPYLGRDNAEAELKASPSFAALREVLARREMPAPR